MPYVLAYLKEMKYYEYESLNLTLREHKILTKQQQVVYRHLIIISTLSFGNIMMNMKQKLKNGTRILSISAEFRRISNELQLRIDKAIELRDTLNHELVCKKWVKEDE